MARELSFPHRRLAEEAVRRGLAAAVVMEAAAREWVNLEGAEPFPDWLVKRDVLRREQVETLAALVASETEGPPGEVGPDGVTARAPHPSEVIKGYRILERLGRGGMGSVYRAEQAGMNRTVALKILRRPLGESEQHVERLRREARLVGALDHPNIVRGLDVGQHGPYHYFAMEFVEGETLREVLKRRGALPEAEALRIVEQLALALDHAQSRGIVHRDVKPGNVILTPDGTPKMTDYGLAKGPTDFALTESGVTIGTPQYISPEQAHDPANVDIQTDLYALGATAYHMLTGVPPHTSETLAGLITKVLYEKPRSARQVNPRVSPGASFLVEKMMAKQRKYRYRTPRDVLRDLRALAAGKSIVPSDWAGDFEVHEVRRRNRTIVAVAACSILAIAGLTTFLQYRSSQALLEARETASSARLLNILDRRRSRTRVGAEERRDDLEEFLRADENRGTRARVVAEEEMGRVQDRLQKWIQAEGYRVEAEKQEQAEQFVRAAETLEKGIAEIEKAGFYGRDPVGWLGSERDRVREKGSRAAEAEAKKALAEAESVPPTPGAADVVENRLVRARERILDRMTSLEGARPVEDLALQVERIRRARARIGESCLGQGFRAESEKAEKDRDYAREEGLLRTAQDRMDEDPVLQDLLRGIPTPAAEDLRQSVAAERRAVRLRNEDWLREVEASAQDLARGGDPDRAIALLEEAERKSVEALRPPLQARGEEIARQRDEQALGTARRLAAFWEGFLADLGRRDYFGAGRRHAASISAEPGTAVPPSLAAGTASARWLLDAMEREAFQRVRERAAAGGAFAEGLQFEDGRRQVYSTVSRVRLKETPTGAHLVFDEPGQPGLEGPLHGLSLRYLLAYSGLSAPSLEREQVLVRAAFVLAEGETATRRDLEREQARLRQVRDDLPEVARPAADALLARADVLVDQQIALEKDLEKTAADLQDAANRAMDAKDPREALRKLDLLLGGRFRGTRYVADHMVVLTTVRAQAEQAMKDLRLEAFFKGARVGRPAVGTPDSETKTKIEWGLDADDELRGFVPPEDHGQPLYGIQKDPADAPALPGVPPRDGGGNGRLVFLSPEPVQGEVTEARGIRDSPLVLECPFVPSRYIAVSFRYCSPAPLYLQVSIVGNHIGVLTDDGSRTSGRGVFGWQDDDWRNADQAFPEVYRHDYVRTTIAPRYPDLLKFPSKQGQRYFQFEPGVAYDVRVVWNSPAGHLQLFVDGEEKWNVDLRDKLQRDKPPRIRIVTYTPCWIDDLAIEGTPDENYIDRLLRGK